MAIGSRWLWSMFAMATHNAAWRHLTSATGINGIQAMSGLILDLRPVMGDSVTL